MEVIIKGNKIKKVFGTKGNVFTALDGINLTVSKGEFVGIMGPSGSGKSTLLNILATIDQPTTGDVVIEGKNPTKMNEEQLSTLRREKLGFIFQDYHLLDTLTVQDNILLPVALMKKNITAYEKKVDELAARFNMKDILNLYPYQISGGQKQRTAVIRAIITQPSLILADEPTGALDSKSANDFLKCLKDINEQDKATILMVTHDAMAASFCKRVLFIKDGQMFKELVKGQTPRKEYFKEILQVLDAFGGEV
jgi:putative ABC transport system ATP-binding protein